MARQWLIPGGGFVNEAGTEAYMIPGVGFIAESSPSSCIRLRFLIDATGNPDSINAQLEYRYKPSGGSFGSWTKV